MRYQTSCILLAFVASVTAVQSQAIEITPGKWTIRTEMQTPMSPAPQVNVTEQCISETEFDPITSLAQGGECRILSKDESATRLQWEMECGAGNMGSLRGTGIFETTGTTARGEVSMNMAFGGQNMQMKNAWEGRYLGPCD